MRLATITWHDGYKNVIGLNWHGRTETVRMKLSDAIANECFRPDHAPQVIRLPRRAIVDDLGYLHFSRADYETSIRNRLSQARSYL